ncbi:MAG: hypothetical protein AB7H80_03440 [Candidatus Kapaibacterium sp.]
MVGRTRFVMPRSSEASRRWSGAIGYLSTSRVRLITSLRYVLSDRVVNGRQNPLCHAEVIRGISPVEKSNRVSLNKSSETHHFATF